MKRYETVRAWTSNNWDRALDLIRIYVGIALIMKAVFFLSNRTELINLIDETGTMWWAPAMIAHYVIMSHLAGGFLLVIGFLTRLAAVIQIPILLGAVFWIHMPRMVSLGAQDDLSYSALLLFLTVVITAYGAGRWSVDQRLFKSEGDLAHPVGTPTTV